MKQSTKISVQFGSATPPFGQKMQPSTQADSRTCPHCGAPILSEVCQYCGTYVGQVATSELTPEYELVHCKNAKPEFWNVGFPLLFGGPFFLFGVPTLFTPGLAPALYGGPFLLAGLVSIFIALKNLVNYMSTKKHGVVREGVVYGYMDDVVAYNGHNGQRIKILLDTAEGKKFIMLPLRNTVKLYEVNSPIRVLLYQNFAMITNKPADEIKW